PWSGNGSAAWGVGWDSWPCISTRRRPRWRSLTCRTRRPRPERVMNESRKKELVAEAKEIARRVDSWIGLSNALSDPVGGLIVRYFPDTPEREEFRRSAEYEELNQLLLRTIKRKGLYPRPGQGGNGTRMMGRQ